MAHARGDLGRTHPTTLILEFEKGQLLMKGFVKAMASPVLPELVPDISTAGAKQRMDENRSLACHQRLTFRSIAITRSEPFPGVVFQARNKEARV